MTDPASDSPGSHRWSPSRHQGLLATTILVALVFGLALGGAFGTTAPATTSPEQRGPEHGVRGVTPTSIRIVLYQPPENDPVSKIVAQFVAPADTNAEIETTVRGFIKALGTDNPSLRGRKVDLRVFTGSANLLDSVAARADAVKIAEDIRPFMVWNGPLLGTAFGDELAARGVMCIQCVNGGTNKFFADHAPYVWTLQTTPEQVAAHTAEYVRKRLFGRSASFAGDAELRRTTRRFGLLSVRGPYGGEGLDPSIARELEAAGVELTDHMAYGDANAVNQVQATMIGRLKARGVTTIIYAGDPIAMGSFIREATAQQWFPEWVMTGGYSSERSSWSRANDPAQMAHAFGITPLPTPLSPKSDTTLNLYRTANGTEPPTRQSAQILFAPVYLFFSALGAAGGDVDPRRFRQGLFDAPPIGGNPEQTSIPGISFSDEHDIWPYDDYAGIDDFAEIWWDPDARGPDDFGVVGDGLWVFADGGRRYLPGAWPAGPPHAFRRRGSVTVIGE